MDEQATRNVAEKLMEGYNVYFTAKIAFEQDEPVGGSSFLKDEEGKEYFIKENKLCYTRSVFPCLDYVDDYYNVSLVRVATDLVEMTPFCLGNKIERGKIEGLFVTDFEVNKTLSPNFLNLVVGEFIAVEIPLEDRQVVFHCQGKEVAYKLQRKIEEYSNFLKELDIFEKQQLKVDISLTTEVNWLVMSNQFPYSITKIATLNYVYSYEPLFYYDTIILDSQMLLDSKSIDTNLFIKCETLRRYACAAHLWKIAIYSHNDYWVFFGICSFVADVFMLLNSEEMLSMAIMEKKKQYYYKLVKTGKDVSPLTNPFLLHPSELFFDECFTLKSNLIFWLIFPFTELKSSGIGILAGFLLAGDGGFYDPIKKKIQYTKTQTIFKKIRHSFGVKNLKHHLSQYLSKTGTTELDTAYSYNRRDNRIKLTIRQTPLHLKYYKKVMEERFKLEKFFNKISPIQQTFESFEASLMDLAKSSDGYIPFDSIQAFLDDDGRILVNSHYNSLKYLSGEFKVIITETNEIEFRESLESFKLEEVQDQEININMKAKFRRVVQKKTYSQDNQVDFTGGDESVLGEKQTNPEDGMVGGAPYLWVKLDPYNKYMSKILIQDGENILLAQLDKDMKDHSDLPSIFKILENLRGTATQAGVNKLCTYIMDKKNIINEFLKIEMVNTLFNLKIKGIESRIYDILISLIKQIKFEDDSSLKPNNFGKGANYHLLNHLITTVSQYERKLKKTTMEKKTQNSHLKINPQTDEVVVSLLLSLLQKNDNSYNKYTDLFYQSNVLRSLFRCLNLANFVQVLNEVNRFLRIEFYTKYEYKFLLKTIFENFLQFVTNHFDLLGINLASSTISLFKNPALNRFPELMEMLENLKKLSERHQCDIMLASSIFRMKLHIKTKIKEYKTWEVLIWSLKYVEKIRKMASPGVTSKVFKEVNKYIEESSSEYTNMLMKLSIDNRKLINKILFETVNSPYSLTDIRYKYLAINLYKLMYNDFLPICHFKELAYHTFPFDPNWLSFKYQLNFEKSLGNQAKMITLNHLNLQKRKKAIAGPMGPAEGSSKYNLRDLLIQNFRFNKETLTWTSLGKQLVNVLLGERTTMRIENDIEEERKILKEKGEPLENDVISLKRVIKKLLKNNKTSSAYESMTQFESDLKSIVENYLALGYITKEWYDEYLVFIKAMLMEINKLLNDKMKKEETKLRALGTKIRIQT